MEDLLRETLGFLNKIQVSGQNNMTYLLAAIRNLELLKKAFTEKEEEKP